MEKRTFVITGENGQPVAVINAEKSTLSLGYMKRMIEFKAQTL